MSNFRNRLVLHVQGAAVVRRGQQRFAIRPVRFHPVGHRSVCLAYFFFDAFFALDVFLVPLAFLAELFFVDFFLPNAEDQLLL